MVTLLKLVVFLIVLFVFARKAVRFKGRSLMVDFKNLPLNIIILVGVVLFFSAIGIVPAGYRGVVLRFGAVTGRILPEGIYVVTPIAERVEAMSVQVEAYSAEAESASKDLQDVRTKVTLNYYLDQASVTKIYQTLRREYQARIITPAIQEAVKASTAQFDAEKLIMERPEVKSKIENNLRERLKDHGIILDAVSITDFKFSPQFTSAIEAKVTATQLALKAGRDLERIKMEAQQKIESAKAEAESLRIQKEQVTAQLVDLRRIEVQRFAIEKWNGALPQIVTGSGPVPILDVFQPKK